MIYFVTYSILIDASAAVKRINKMFNKLFLVFKLLLEFTCSNLCPGFQNFVQIFQLSFRFDFDFRICRSHYQLDYLIFREFRFHPYDRRMRLSS